MGQILNYKIIEEAYGSELLQNWDYDIYQNPQSPLYRLYLLFFLKI